MARDADVVVDLDGDAFTLSRGSRDDGDARAGHVDDTADTGRCWQKATHRKRGRDADVAGCVDGVCAHDAGSVAKGGEVDDGAVDRNVVDGERHSDIVVAGVVGVGRHLDA